MKNKLAFFLAVATSSAMALPSLDEMPNEVRRISREDIRTASAAVTQEAYPDAEDIVLDSVTFERYEEDGTSVTYDDTYTKILTEKGRRNAATDSMYFNVSYGTNEIIAAEILKPDGSVVEIDLDRNMSVMTDSGSMGDNIYDPHDKIMRVSYPGLEVGDVVRLAFKRTEHKARVPGVWSDYQIFESFSPVRRFTYAVSSPEALPIRNAALRAPVEGTVSSNAIHTADGRIIGVWEVADVPQAFAEPDMPPLHSVCQRLLLSTAPDWEHLSKWYWNLCKPHLEATTDGMRKLVDETIASATAPDKAIDTEAVVRGLFTFVSQRIRYMGVTPETEAPGYEPHDASMTFENRYGVCRDKAALLVALLRMAGVDAYPVLIHVGEKRDAEVPMTFFNHAIAAVRNADGSYTLMDPTNESTRDLLPSYLNDKSYLVAHPDGETIRVSPIVPASENMLSVTTEGNIDEKGTICLTTWISFAGINDTVYRGAFARMPKEKRRDFFDGVARRIVPGATLEDFSITPENLQDTDTPLEATFVFSAKDFIAKGDSAAVLEIPFVSDAVGYVNFLVGSLGLEERRFPLETGMACGVKEDVGISLADAATPIALPEDISLSTNGVVFKRTCNLDAVDGGSVLRASRRFSMEKTLYEPDIYKGLKATLHDIEHANDGRVVLSIDDNGLAKADTVLLSRNVRHDLVSPSSWTTTVTTVRQILTYAGKKRNSELVIEYNPAWEEVELLEATVSNANGRVQSVTDIEKNTLDASWVASAPRYPSGRIFVASLPGVETGSVTRVSYRIIHRNAPFFSFAAVMQGVDPIHEYGVTVSAPTNIALAVKAFGCVAEEEEMADGGCVVRTWSVSHPKTLPREERLPPAFAYAACVYVSAGDWREYAGDVLSVVKEALAPEGCTAAREKAHELCDAIAGTPDKVVAIRDFVAKDIRFAGPMFTEIPLSATSPDTTLADGYGNALDKAVLLSAMLDAIGLDAHIVLADPFDRLDPGLSIDGLEDPRYDLPSPDVFTRPLVAVEPEKGRRVYLNDTDQYAHLGVTPSQSHWFLPLSSLPVTDIMDIAGYDMSEFGEGAVLLHTINAPFHNADMSETTIALDATGNAKVSVTMTGSGTKAASMRKLYEEMTPEKLSRHHQELVGTISMAAVADGPIVLSVSNHPAKVSFSALAPDYAVRSGKTLTLTLPEPDDVLTLKSEARRLPIATPALDDGTSVMTILLPPETEEILMKPGDISWTYSGMGFVRRKIETFATDDGRKAIRITESRQSRHRTILGAEFAPTLLEMNRAISSPAQCTIVLRLK